MASETTAAQRGEPEYWLGSAQAREAYWQNRARSAEAREKLLIDEVSNLRKRLGLP